MLVSYGYDAAGQLTAMEETASGKLFWYRQFGYDAAGQITSELVAPKPKACTLPARNASYDLDNRLQSWNGAGVTADADGNMTSGLLLNDTPVPYAYNARPDNATHRHGSAARQGSSDRAPRHR